MPTLLKGSAVTEWFFNAFGAATPAQASAWPKIQAGKNVLIVSPTGTGKTLAAFLSVLSELALAHDSGQLRKGIYAIYISPLRALNYDLEKNLNQPLAQIYSGKAPIRVALRTGDTSQSERQRQLAEPPHILLTTPESLCLLLTQTKWLSHLQSTRWVIVDEIHALASSKRGAHLSLSLERLEDLIGRRSDSKNSNQFGETEDRLQRIGLSATVAPLPEIANFLVGAGRECEIVDASSAKQIDLRVYSPLRENPYPPSGYTGQRLIEELARLVVQNRTTLVFTNTRSGAEAATFWLREALPDLADRIECHHASLDRDVRQEVEDRLKQGELRAVVCSTSLELGIDIGTIDLVVMLSTPKGVSRALQRTGRSGHNIRTISRGLLMATNMNDLVECCATALLARRRHLDQIRLPRAPLDVLAQHLASAGCTRQWLRKEAFHLVQRAYPYRNLSEQEFNDVLDYLAGGGKSLRQQYREVFGKIDLDDDSFVTRPGGVRRDLLQNIGVIPNEGVVHVRLKSRTLGMVEESFLHQLQVGDVFVIGGRPVRLERVGAMECFVSRADHALPTVPRWNANKMPLANNVAEEIIRFRSELRDRLRRMESTDATRSGATDSLLAVPSDEERDVGRSLKTEPAPLTTFPTEELNSAMVHWIADRLDCGRANARIIFKMFWAQHQLSAIPTAESLLVEEYVPSGSEEEALAAGSKERKKSRRAPTQPRRAVRHYFFHSLIGRAANEALSRVVARRLSRLRGGNAVATPDDYGFVLTVAETQQFNAPELHGLLSCDNFQSDLQESLARSHLLKHHFRNAAQAGLMVYRNFFGEQKPVRKLHWSTEVIFNVLQQYEPDHVLLREARRDAAHTYLDEEGAISYLKALASTPVHLQKIDRVPPLAFAMCATKIKEALLVEDPREMMERLFHHWWERIGGSGGVKRDA